MIDPENITVENADGTNEVRGFKIIINNNDP